MHRLRTLWLRRLVTRVVGAPEPAPLPEDDLWAREGVAAVRELAAFDAALYRSTSTLERAFARLDNQRERLDHLLAERPDLAWARFLRGLTWFRAGSLEAAVEEMERSVDGVPDLAGAHFELGRLYLARYLEEQESARRHITERGITEDLLVARRRLDQAAIALEEARRLRGGESSWHDAFARAVRRLAENDLAGCVAVCERILADEPDLEDVWRLRGDALALAGEDPEPSWERALDVRRSDYGTLRALARWRLGRGEHGAAREALERALAIHPRFAAGWALLARVRLRGGSGERRRERLRRGIRARPARGRARARAPRSRPARERARDGRAGPRAGAPRLHEPRELARGPRSLRARRARPRPRRGRARGSRGGARACARGPHPRHERRNLARDRCAREGALRARLVGSRAFATRSVARLATLAAMSELQHMGRVVERQLEISATPDAIWTAWADPEKIARWFCDRAEGVARAGETQTWHFDLFNAHFSLPVLDVRRGESITWGGDLPGMPSFLQELSIAREGGASRVTIRNSGFRESEMGEAQAEGVASGWEVALATLKRFLELYPRESRTHLMTLRPVDATLAAAQPFFETAAGLSRWLAEKADLSEEPLGVGARLSLALADGGTLSGEVLVRTPLEVLVSWEEENGVLGLKTFQRTSEETVVGLDFNAWPLASPFQRLHELLDRSATRLAVALS